MADGVAPDKVYETLDSEAGRARAFAVLDKIKTSMWNPDGAIIVDRPFGVGWTLNIGAVVAKVRSMSNTG